MNGGSVSATTGSVPDVSAISPVTTDMYASVARDNTQRTPAGETDATRTVTKQTGGAPTTPPHRTDANKDKCNTVTDVRETTEHKLPTPVRADRIVTLVRRL